MLKIPACCCLTHQGNFISLATRLPWKFQDWCYDYTGVLVCVHTLVTSHHLHGYQPIPSVRWIIPIASSPCSHFCPTSHHLTSVLNKARGFWISRRSYHSSVQTVQMASYHSDWKWVFKMIFICPDLISYITSPPPPHPHLRPFTLCQPRGPFVEFGDSGSSYLF